MLSQCGFDCYGVETTDEIVDQVRNNISEYCGIVLNTGNNTNLPYIDEYFNYALSWNVVITWEVGVTLMLMCKNTLVY